ncbi:hypothetical protein E5720_18835 [Rhodococcus sp. PAMC28707]|uniref:hypothetical protein n=1 Tax=unclassified Rhodococcus (in: high G+C Gram-positive bacteria) TaxID=192944 RepID=UPI00109DF8A6|nr:MULTISPECIES: hypothetical protein [unclassified Rhodococcus (in: high G+C Gram-positive bacteria)]QCB51608.1 hypothetical protein E5769_16690 [Rhodococcus sp. PAMC28705]QCB60224.1 hypothetical protein E5720_18835 [Rhodococcus sp. PAMC28707]
MEDGWCHLSFASDSRPKLKNSGVELQKSFSLGGLHIDQLLEEATVVVADAVQTELAGYPPFVQWPIEEKRLLLPVARAGAAIWRDPRTDRSVAEIGLLKAAS